MSEKLVALISGANRGIGFETARQLGGLGYAIWVGARDEIRGQQAVNELVLQGIEARFVRLDAEDPTTFRAVADTLQSASGRLDVLVNNAGILEDFGRTIEEVPIDLWRRTFDINFFALVELTQALLPLLRKSQAGRIVNVSSILGSLTLNADPTSPISTWHSPAYNASKAAVNAFTAILATELSQTPIKVNSAHPGWVKTALGSDDAPMEIVDGAKTSVALATLGPEGPTGAYLHMGEVLPW